MRVVLATGPMAPEPGGVPLTTAPGALGAGDVATALADGWRRARPEDELVLVPLSDGGPGCADTVPAAVVAERQEITNVSPLGEPRTAVLVGLARPVAGSQAPDACVCALGSDGQALLTREPAVDGRPRAASDVAPAAGEHARLVDGPERARTAPRTWLLDAAGLVAVPCDPAAAAREASEGTTAGLGQALVAALERTAAGDTLVVGLGRSAVHDGGVGLLEAMGGLERARERVRGRDLVLALADDVALSGLSGAGQALATLTSLTPEQAQERDRAASSAAAAALAALTERTAPAGPAGRSVVTGSSGQTGLADLMGARGLTEEGDLTGASGLAGPPGRGDLADVPGPAAPTPLARPAHLSLPLVGDRADSHDGQRLSVTSWGSGAAGGAALVLRALGARALPGSRVMASLTGLAQQVSLAAGTDLVVTASGEVYDVLADCVPAVVGELAATQALPVVLVCARSLVPRGELAEAGITAAYSLEATAGGEVWDGGSVGVVERLTELGQRLARTWSR